MLPEKEKGVRNNMQNAKIGQKGERCKHCQREEQLLGYRLVIQALLSQEDGAECVTKNSIRLHFN